MPDEETTPVGEDGAISPPADEEEDLEEEGDGEETEPKTPEASADGHAGLPENVRTKEKAAEEERIEAEAKAEAERSAEANEE